MKALRTASVLLAAALVGVALPASASAQYVVPPDNSAVNQYTETVPTAGGGREPGEGDRSPSKALGPRNASRLNAQGPDGRAAAQLAATTSAPSASTPAPSEPGDGASASGEGGRAATNPGRASPPASGANPSPANAEDGSSGFGEVVSQATGASSSGETGVVLPIVILAALAWSLGYFWRQRRRID